MWLVTIHDDHINYRDLRGKWLFFSFNSYRQSQNTSQDVKLYSLLRKSQAPAAYGEVLKVLMIECQARNRTRSYRKNAHQRQKAIIYLLKWIFYKDFIAELKNLRRGLRLLALQKHYRPSIVYLSWLFYAPNYKFPSFREIVKEQ